MAKIIIAFDEDDDKAGTYYRGCASHLLGLITSQQDVTSISKNKLNNVYLDHLLSGLIDEKFLFCAYSHGIEDRLQCDGGHYLSTSSDLTPFNNTLFYSYACLAGVEFGQDLIKNGCIAFFGYKNTVSHYTAHEHLFIECANFGIKMMLEGDDVATAENKMKENYENEADRLCGLLDLVAAELVDTRDSLIVLGRKNFKLAELEFV